MDSILIESEEKLANEMYEHLKFVYQQSGQETFLIPQPPVRCYVDGAFDLVHAGHFNAIRQASLLCDELVVGVNSSKDIEAVKGPVVLTDTERNDIIRSCKFVTEVEPTTPYNVSVEVIDKFNCQYYAHGDDPCYVDGVDICAQMEAIGRFKQFKRTTGVSTTNITGKLLKLVEPGDANDACLPPKQ